MTRAHFKGMRVKEVGATVVDSDPVTLVEITAHGGLTGDDRFSRAQQIRVGQLEGVAERVAERRAGVEFQHPVNGVAQRLGRDGAPMGAAAADQMVFFDCRHRFPFLGGFHGGPFAAGTGANHNDIIILVVHGRARRG